MVQCTTHKKNWTGCDDAVRATATKALCRVLDTNLEGIQEDHNKLTVGARFALGSTSSGWEWSVK